MFGVFLWTFRCYLIQRTSCNADFPFDSSMLLLNNCVSVTVLQFHRKFTDLV